MMPRSTGAVATTSVAAGRSVGLDDPAQQQLVGDDLRRRHLLGARDLDAAVRDLREPLGDLLVQHARIDEPGGRRRGRDVDRTTPPARSIFPSASLRASVVLDLAIGAGAGATAIRPVSRSDGPSISCDGESGSERRGRSGRRRRRPGRLDGLGRNRLARGAAPRSRRLRRLPQLSPRRRRQQHRQPRRQHASLHRDLPPNNITTTSATALKPEFVHLLAGPQEQCHPDVAQLLSPVSSCTETSASGADR